MGEHLLRAIRKLGVILGLVRHIIGVAGDEDEIIFLQRHAGNHFVIELLQQFFILQLGLAQLHEQAVLLTANHLLVAERNVDKILAQRAGQRFFEQIEIGIGFFVRRKGERLRKDRDNAAVFIDITAVYFGDIISVALELPAQLCNFFLIHGGLLLSV